MPGNTAIISTEINRILEYKLSLLEKMGSSMESLSSAFDDNDINKTDKYLNEQAEIKKSVDNLDNRVNKLLSDLDISEAQLIRDILSFKAQAYDIPDSYRQIYLNTCKLQKLLLSINELNDRLTNNVTTLLKDTQTKLNELKGNIKINNMFSNKSVKGLFLDKEKI